jgi:diguanylate cyclase (GGDEF)-like protein/PAS domain S-box-containing protein
MLALRKPNEYREIFLRHPQPMYVYERATLRFLKVNDAACRDYGYTREQFLQMTILDLRPKADRVRAAAHANELGIEPAGATLWRHVRADGNTFYVDESSTAIMVGKKPARIVLAVDATARLGVSQALSESRTALGEAQELAHLGSFETDLETGEVRWSAELFRIFGVDPAHERPTLLYAFDHPDDRASIAREIARARDDGGTFTLEHRIRTRDGRERQVFERGRFYYENGRPRRVVGAILDITDRKHAEDQLRRLAEHDALTELPNRTLIRAQLADALEHATRDGTHVAVLFVDLDRFKTINDTISHMAGDDLLRELAERLTATLGGRGLVGRPGGDEFTIVLDGLNDEMAAVAVGYEIVAAISEPIAYDDVPLIVTASVGVALFPRDGTTPDELLRSSDSAMYAAKARGGNAVDVYRPSLHVAAVAELELERALRGALERDELRVAYQPIVHGPTGRVVAFEALVRWDENGQPIAPNDFIPLAEATGLIVRLGSFVLHQACEELRRLREAGYLELTMCVNISARQFREYDFAARVRSALEAAGIPAGRLELEITESAYLSVESGVRNMQALEELGVRLSIDDFGTGYSSLGYLKRLPVNTLKIDRSFVADILTDGADQAIVRAIIAVAQNLSLAVIAEGVETAEHAAFLQSLGCTYLQGFFYARALPPEQLEAFLGQPLRPAHGS